MRDEIEKKVVELPPFKKFCMTIGELPASYLETMTYYEMLVWFTKYLGETVIPTINNNAEAIEELQDLFVKLQTYVNNYFDNLDVQEEINNKIDAMIEDGTLQSILMNYANVTKTYNTFDELIEDTTIVDNMKVKTLGYHNINDNGNGSYYISENSNLNGYKVNSAVTGLYIYLIEDKGVVNVKQFGAYGDGTHDDTTAIQNAINYINETDIETQQIVPSNPSWLRYFATSKTLYFPNGKYLIENTLNFNGSRYYNIDGNNSYIESSSSLPIFKFSDYGGTKSIIKNLVFNEVYNAITFDSTDLDTSKVNIENCKFIGTKYIAIIYDNRSSMLTLKNCIFSWCYKVFKNIRCDNVEFNDCWFSEYEANENNHTSFEILWGENKFINCLFIPNGKYNPDINQDNFNNLAWILAGDNTTARVNNPSLIFDKCRISSEQNSKTLINWQVVPNAITNPSDTSIKILNCYQLASQIGDTVIKLWHLPQQLIVENSDLRIEDNTFIKLDDSLDVDTEITTYATSPNRLQYTFDYSIKDCKTQTSTAWKLIPYKLIELFRNCDYDIRLPLSSTNKKLQIPLGSQSLGNTNSFNRMYLVKAYFNPIDAVSGMSSVVGLLMFDAVNSTVESTSSIRVKFVKLAQYGGGSSNSEDDEINIIPTFQNNSNIITMAGNQQMKLNLELENVVYNNNESYITLKRI